MTREERIVVLAWSLLDAIRQPRTSMSDDRPRRPSPSERRLCGTCDGSGVTVDRFGRETVCVSCDGNGWYAVDTYTESRVATATSTAEPRVERVGCSWCQPSHGREPAGRWESLPRGTGVRGVDRCEHCDGTGWRTLTLAGDDTTRRGRRGELVAWTMHGDWPALLAALERLRRADRRAHRAFLREAETDGQRFWRNQQVKAFLDLAKDLEAKGVTTSTDPSAVSTVAVTKVDGYSQDVPNDDVTVTARRLRYDDDFDVVP